MIVTLVRLVYHDAASIGQELEVADAVKFYVLHYVGKHPFDKDGAYFARVTDYIGIGPDRELGDPATHPTQWMMIGIAMAIVENGTTNLDYLSMLKGWAMANDYE